MTDREVMQQALRAFNLYLDWDGKDSSMLGTFDIAANIVKDKLNAAIAQPQQSAAMPEFEVVGYRFDRPGINKIDTWPHGGYWEKLIQLRDVAAVWPKFTT